MNNPILTKMRRKKDRGSAKSRACRNILLVSFYFLFTPICFVKSQNFSEEILSEKFEAYQEKNFVEKLYIHTDRDYYVAGEIAWLSIYALSAENTFTGISSVAYLELVDNDQKVVVKEKISLKDGQGSGSFYIPVSLESGVFTLRAYTRWMRNDEPAYFFQKPLTIVNTFVASISTNANAKNTREFDIQFLPEGGTLLAGHENRVAFKALNADGKGVKVNGALMNSSGDTLQLFKDNHIGMGSFNFTPDVDAVYTAKVEVEGQVVEKELPNIASKGYGLRISSTRHNIEAKCITTYNEPYLILFVHHNGKLITSSALDVKAGEASLKMNIDEMQTGIHHFTLFNSRGKPVAERLYFRLPEKNEIINTIQKQPKVGTRKKHTLSIKSLSKTPARLSLGVSLIDSLEATDQVDIRSWIWLLSDLEGYIENPQYYFTETGEEVAAAMESLMLTQGWRRFEWENVLDPKPFENVFLPEMEGPIFEVYVKDKETGELSGGVESYLFFPGKDFGFYPQKSDTNGKLTFVLEKMEGLQSGMIMGFTASDSTWEFSVIDPFEQRKATNIYPKLHLDEKFRDVLTERSVSMQAQNIYIDEKLHQFEKKTVDTIPFYGIPDYSYILDDYTRFPTMEEVMREYVPKVAVRKTKDEFYFKVFDQPNEINFQRGPLILLDGMPILSTNEVLKFNPLKIKSLDVLSRRFVMNNVSFTGIVSYRTYNGDYTWQKPHKGTFTFDYNSVQEKRIFYQPAYKNTEVSNNKLPDFRTLLYWNPSLQLDANGEIDIQFFTSDKTGMFKGVIQGLTQDGQPIYHTFNFEVNELLD